MWPRFRNFRSVPQGADTYLNGVIQDWDDSRATRILRNCLKAMTKKSRVLRVDIVMPDSAPPSFGKLLDLNVLVMNGGRERTRSEFCALLEAARYKLSGVIPTRARGERH